MALRPIHMVSDHWFAQLNASVTSGATTLVLKSSGATGLPDVSAREDCILHCDTEKVLVTAIAVDTPSAGLDSLTVQRGYGGTTPASHSADTYVGQFYYREHNNTLARENAQLRGFLRAWIGGDGVVQDGGLQVVATGTPDLNVNVTAGFALVAGDVVALWEDTVTAVTAPVTNPRIDTVQLTQAGTIEILTGTESGSPSAPSVDADAIKRAEVYCRVGMTSVKDTDDASNGYITMTENYL